MAINLCDPENLAGQVTTTAWDCCLAYGYNEKSELTNAVAAVDSNYRYAYDFNDIGNRESSSERGTNSVYTANQLNQYTVVDDFIPQFDDDGNQTFIKTATGIWSVTYNGENRPIVWENVSTNSPAPNSSTPSLISMSYDRMDRRVTKNNQRFVYDGYLQIADNNGNIYVWDPAEPVATRPLAWLVLRSLGEGGYYTHDGNSETFAAAGRMVFGRTVKGYRIDTWSDGTGWVKGAEQSGRTATLDGEKSFRRLVWLWGKSAGLSILVR